MTTIFLGFFGIFQIVVSFVDLECSPNLEILWPGRLLGTFRNLIFWDNFMFLAPADEQLGWSFRILPREFVTPLYPFTSLSPQYHPVSQNITWYHPQNNITHQLLYQNGWNSFCSKSRETKIGVSFLPLLQKNRLQPWNPLSDRIHVEKKVFQSTKKTSKNTCLGVLPKTALQHT